MVTTTTVLFSRVVALGFYYVVLFRLSGPTSDAYEGVERSEPQEF